MPRESPVGKVTMVKLYGAEIEFVDGGFDDAVNLALSLSKDEGVMFVGDYYWRREGQKTISFELWEQLSSIDWVVCPVGSGVLMSAIYKGFWELKKLKLLDRIPRVVGVQAEGCSPVARAWKGGLMARWSKPSTIASAIRVERPYDAPLAVKAARESGGRILTVSDREIMDALVYLARSEGLFVEPGAATPIAAIRNNWKLFDGRVVCILTGSSLTYLTLTTSKRLNTTLKGSFQLQSTVNPFPKLYPDYY